MTSASAACRRAPVLGVGIDLDAMLIVRELDAAALEIGKAVEHVAAVEIGPARHGARQEAAIAGGRREIEHLLAGRLDPWADDVGKQLGQPRSEREDETVGANALAR